MTTLYGIPNCASVKKGRLWLTDNGVKHDFHDFKKQGVTQAILSRWLAVVGWQALVNRKGTTWRKLDDRVQAAVLDDASAIALMLAQPSVIKRPVVVWADGTVTVGFDANQFAQRLAKD
jgi:Spx/MgsR family transcriptional regulator